ncbi:MAG: hypothetical protein LBI71_01710 [Enterobacteriaceae bacterium]|nr:hypothetical protein [Enterobacteriaceae bacterium]
MAHVFGDRSRKTLNKLLALLASFEIQYYCTDNYAVYDCLPEENHRTSKGNLTIGCMTKFIMWLGDKKFTGANV